MPNRLHELLNCAYLIKGMMRVSLLPIAFVALLAAAPSVAGASSFSIANGVGVDLSDIAIRRVGSGQWKPLNIATPAGQAAAIPFSDPDCAFDIRATLSGGPTVTWSSVNLCDVKLVTLRRNAAGFAWVDYD